MRSRLEGCGARVATSELHLSSMPTGSSSCAASSLSSEENETRRSSLPHYFNDMDAPSKFGREYLTYVLWAVTPEGRPKNLGEVVLNGTTHSKLDVTTELQAFGLIVTAIAVANTMRCSPFDRSAPRIKLTNRTTNTPIRMATPIMPWS